MEDLVPSRDESEPKDAIQERHGVRRTAEDSENDEGGDGQVQSTETSSSTGVSGDVGCFRAVYNFLYGRQLSPGMMLRSLCLSSALFFIQASFSMLEEKRVSVVKSMQTDYDDILHADARSFVVLIIMVLLYSCALDIRMPRHRLFYGLGSIYAIVFGIIGIGLKASHEATPDDTYSTSPRVMLGWIQYIVIAPFGLILLSLFWSFTNSNCSLDVALGSYGVMLAVMGMGGLLGLTLAKHLVASSCFVMAALLLVAMQGCIAMYVKMYGVDERNRTPHHIQVCFLDGCKVFCVNHYVKGIFVVGSFYIMLQPLTDTTFGGAVEVYAYWTAAVRCINGIIVDDVCEYYDWEGVRDRVTNLFEECVGILSFVMPALATSYILRRWGAGKSLTFFPYLCVAGLIAPWLRLVGRFAIPISFWISFVTVAVQKASVYGLFRPLTEILYLPTGDAVRYKARVWIDAIGPVVFDFVATFVLTYVYGGSYDIEPTVGLVLFGPVAAVPFVLISRMMGERFEHFVENGYVVGVIPSFETIPMTDDDNDEDEGTELEMNPSQGGNKNAETQALNIIV